jgi:hypothetical protein
LEFINSDETDRIVTIEPHDPTSKIKIQHQLGLKVIEPLSIRLIKYNHDGTTFYLGTTLIDGLKYPTATFSEAYHARWGAEELYKISKIFVETEDFHSRSERGVLQELFAHFVLITLARILANEAEGNLNAFEILQPSKIAAPDPRPFNAPIKVNFKNCLTSVSHYLEALVRFAGPPLVEVVNRVFASIRTVNQKFRPNRKYERVSFRPVKKWQLPKARKLALAQATARRS